MFDAFMEKEKKSVETVQTVQDHKNGVAGKQHGTGGQKKKKQQPQKEVKEKWTTLEEAAKEVCVRARVLLIKNVDKKLMHITIASHSALHLIEALPDFPILISDITKNNTQIISKVKKVLFC